MTVLYTLEFQKIIPHYAVLLPLPGKLCVHKVETNSFESFRVELVIARTGECQTNTSVTLVTQSWTRLFWMLLQCLYMSVRNRLIIRSSSASSSNALNNDMILTSSFRRLALELALVPVTDYAR